MIDETALFDPTSDGHAARTTRHTSPPVSGRDTDTTGLPAGDPG
ncbi:hypothetical protein [Natronobiforma cellulositropha]|nr:hypothetical protein [Natronobiforma cellulositropha]